MVLEKIFNVLSNCKVMRANDHRDVAILGHMGMQKLRVRLGSCKTGLSPPVTLCY